MAITLYSYEKLCDSDRLKQEIEASAIVTAIDHIETGSAPEVTNVYMKAELSGGDEIILDGIVDEHVNTPLPDNEIKTVSLDVPKDAEDAVLTRPKTTRPGWHYQPRWITFTTSLFGAAALHNKKADAITDYGDAALRFWKKVGGAWVELLRENYLTDLAYQLALTTECTITTMDWWAQFDFDIRGGIFLNGPRAIAPSYGYIVIAPDIPAHLGGSVPFLDGGVPLHLMDDYGHISQDAGTVKSFAFDAVYKSNKIRLIIDHPIGTQVDLALAFQIYKL